MNIMIWLAAGAAVAWLSIAVLHINKNRGLIPTLIIGALGAIIGGQTFAPMLSSTVTETEIGFNPFALVVALATAIACLVISNMLSKRYGI